MEKQNKCPDCGADWSDGKTCTDHFHMMEFWELDYQLLDRHHLMVIAYNLQHPHIYSPDALHFAQGQLVDFLENDVSPQQMRQKISKQLDSENRKFKVTGTHDSHGTYKYPIEWSMTCADVIAAGIDSYYVSVEKWAHLILQDLRETRNFQTTA